MKDRRIVVIGHKDHGKSTLIGRLLYEGGFIKPDKISEVEKYSVKAGFRGLNFAFFTDSFEEERKNGMTIDIVYVNFRSRKYSFTLIDCPGHRELIKNMLTGASSADAALLVVSADAGEGVQKQTEEHLRLAGTIGIRSLVIAVNKMDSAHYSAKRFHEISASLKEYCKSLGIGTEGLSCVPVSAVGGDNIWRKSSKMKWYGGKPLVPLLDALKVTTKQLARMPLRISVQDSSPLHSGTKMIFGRVESGIVKKRDDLIFAPSGTAAKVLSIETAMKKRPQAGCGSMVSLTIKVKDADALKRGDVGGHIKNPPGAVIRCAVQLVLFAPGAKIRGNEIVFRCGMAESRCRIEVHKSRSIYTPAKVYLERPIVVEEHSGNPSLGRFTVSKDRQIIGAGIVTSVTPSGGTAL